MAHEADGIYTTDHRDVLSVTLELTRLTGQWPVLQAVHLRLARRGVSDPLACIRAVPGEYLLLDDPAGADSTVRLTFAGLHAIDSAAKELDGFIGAVRTCVERYRFQGESDSPSRARTLRATARELTHEAELSRECLQTIGLLLQVEDVAPIHFDSDGLWSAEIGMSIWRYSDVADIDSYLRFARTRLQESKHRRKEREAGTGWFDLN
jgi:hypothetical protein